MSPSKALTIKETAERLGASRDLVEAHLRSGTLRAIDVSAPGAKRRSWRILPDALLQFEATRSNRTTPKPARRRRRPADVIEYF